MITIAAAFVASAFSADAQGSARVDTTVALSSGGLVEVGLISGTIIVHGADRRDAHVRAETSEGRVAIIASGGVLRLGIDRSGGRYRSGDENRFEIEVPHGVRVIATGTSADIEVHDTRGDVEARTTSGNVTVMGARGRVNVSSTSSDIELGNIEGSVRVSGVSGDQTLTDVSGSVELNTVSGSLQLTGGRIGEFRAESVSGDIEFASEVATGGRYEARTHSGDIVLHLDERTPMVVGAETFSGDVSAAVSAVMLPTPRLETGRARRMELAIGGSEGPRGPRFVVTTFSGDVSLVRRGSER
jgi:hypothetical protein